MGLTTDLPVLSADKSIPFGPDNDYYKAVRPWLDACFEEAKLEAGENIEHNEIEKYINYLVGKQWPGARPKYKATPVNNRTWRLFWELIALLTDIRPTFEIKSLQKDMEAQAKIINTAVKSWWMESDADLNLAIVIIYAILSTGYVKLEWDPLMRGGEGDFKMIPLGMGEVFPIKCRYSLEDGQGVIYQTPRALGWFKRKYGAMGSLVPANNELSRYALPPTAPPHVTQLQFNNLSDAMKRVLSGGNGQQQFADSAYPMAMYREYWISDYSYNLSSAPVQMGDQQSNWGYIVPPGKPLYPRGRLICMGGPVVLHDGPNPYWHGRPPFACLRMNIVPWQFGGVSDLRSLLPLQDIINNILAGVLDMVKKALNPAFMAPKVAFSEAHWNSLDWAAPGARGAYSPMSPHKPEWAPQPQIPAYVLQMMQLAAQEMDQSSGIAAVSEAVRKRQVPSGDTLERIKETQQTPLRVKGRNIEVFLRHIGAMSIPNVFQFYTAKRRFFMMGQDGLTPQDYDFDPGTLVPDGDKPQDHIRKFSMIINPGSLLNANRAEKAIMIMNLRKNHDIDRETMYEQLDMGLNVQEISKRLRAEQAQELATMGVAKQIAAGGGGAPQ